MLPFCGVADTTVSAGVGLCFGSCEIRAARWTGWGRRGYSWRSMLRRGSLGLVVVPLLACSPDVPADLGEWPEDQVVLAGHPLLGHLADALVDGGEG